MNAQSAHWFILLIVNIPVFLGLGRLIFKDWGGFIETVRLWTRVDWLLTLDRQWREDRWDTSKLPVFIVLCVALVLIEHLMFGKTAVKPAAQLVGSGIMGTQSTAMGHSGQIFWSYCDERHTTTYR